MDRISEEMGRDVRCAEEKVRWMGQQVDALREELSQARRSRWGLIAVSVIASGLWGLTAMQVDDLRGVELQAVIEARIESSRDCAVLLDDAMTMATQATAWRDEAIAKREAVIVELFDVAHQQGAQLRAAMGLAQEAVRQRDACRSEVRIDGATCYTDSAGHVTRCTDLDGSP